MLPYALDIDVSQRSGPGERADGLNSATRPTTMNMQKSKKDPHQEKTHTGPLSTRKVIRVVYYDLSSEPPTYVMRNGPVVVTVGLPLG